MNDQHRQYLERLFDGELVADQPDGAAQDAESRGYLRRLGLLRELALAHDPAGAIRPRRSVFVPPRSRRPIVATILTLAASVLFVTFMVHHGRRTDPGPALIPGAPQWPTAGERVAVASINSPRSPRPPLEVELYRWANESSPCRDDAAGVALSRVGSLEGRPASREILALELANAIPGSAVNIPRSVTSRSTPAAVRKLGSLHRHRNSPSPRA
jgi:hypothetical protein